MSAIHTIFEYARWKMERQKLEDLVVVFITTSKVVKMILLEMEYWNKEVINGVLYQKKLEGDTYSSYWVKDGRSNKVKISTWA